MIWSALETYDFIVQWARVLWKVFALISGDQEVHDVRMLTGDARQAVFAPVDDGVGRGVVVVRRLASAIALGILEDGEQLPPESALAASLNVSTVTLRDALADMRARGLLETRRGRGGGTSVRADEAALRTLARSRLTEIGTPELRTLGDLRMAVAGTSARLAAERAGARDLDRLRDLLDQLASAEDHLQQRRSEGRFMIGLAVAAQSLRLTQQEIELQTELGQVSFGVNRPTQEFRAAVRGHRATVKAIERRDGATARDLVERTVEASVRALVNQRMSLSRQEAGSHDEE